MEFEKLYPEFKDYVLNEGKNRFNGIEYFVDFIIEKQGEGSLDEHYDIYDSEEFEAIIKADENLINNLLSWFRIHCHDDIEIKSDFNWHLKNKTSNFSLQSEDYSNLELSEIERLENSTSPYTSDDLIFFKSIYRKLDFLEDQGDKTQEQKAKCLYLIAEAGYRESNQLENANDWFLAGENYKKLNKDNSLDKAYNCFVKAGKIFSYNYDYDRAASSYHEAIKSKDYEKLDSDSKVDYQKLTTDCRIQYEYAGKNDEAAELFVMENNNKLSDSDKIKKIPLILYKWIANYGESPGRVLFSAILLILISTIVYTFFGINISGSTGITNNFFTCLYFSLVTFTTLGYGDFSPTDGIVSVFATFQALSGLMLTSLFMVTLVRKYSR